MAIPPEEAERRCRRALMEAWIGRETATFRLPPGYRMELVVGDPVIKEPVAIAFNGNGRLFVAELRAFAGHGVTAHQHGELRMRRWWLRWQQQKAGVHVVVQVAGDARAVSWCACASG